MSPTTAVTMRLLLWAGLLSRVETVQEGLSTQPCGEPLFKKFKKKLTKIRIRTVSPKPNSEILTYLLGNREFKGVCCSGAFK